MVDRALQVHGSLGYSTDLPLEEMYRFARAARIYDGPDEVHRQSVARQILRGYEPHERAEPSTCRRGARRRGSASPSCSRRSPPTTRAVAARVRSPRSRRAMRPPPTPGPQPRTATVDRFDADRAWALLTYQVGLGPRPAGSPAAARARRLHPRPAAARALRGRARRLRNVVGRLPGRGKAILARRALRHEGASRLRRRQRRRGRHRGAARARPRAATDAPPARRAADPLRRLRRRGEPRRPRRLLRHRPARLQALRRPPRARAARDGPARLRRQPQPRDPARGGLGPGLWARLRARRPARGRRPRVPGPASRAR